MNGRDEPRLNVFFCTPRLYILSILLFTYLCLEIHDYITVVSFNECCDLLPDASTTNYCFKHQ
jgi:hypothetical protein